MNLFVDIDNTIALTEGSDYPNSRPRASAIKIVNEWYDAGHTITYWTARGQNSGTDWTDLTTHQLQEWGCKYHNLRLDKPSFDRFIDDKAIHALALQSPLANKLPEIWQKSPKKHDLSLAPKQSATP